MARVELAGVSKVYAKGVVAVDSLDLTVDNGEMVVLVGPSGSGKTTILRLVAGLERPTTGQIRIAGEQVTGVSPRLRDVSYLAQSCPLYPHLNVFGNIAFGGRVRNARSLLTRLWRQIVPTRTKSNDDVTLAWTRSAEAERVHAAAGRLGIGHLLERWPRQLSGGERQRVALARAIVREPAAFLFDEPLSSLDPGLRSELRRELKSLHGELERATIYVTHDQAEAMTLADRLAVLDRGRLLQIGSPESLYDRPQHRLVASFLGSPPLNLLRGQVQRGSSGWRFVMEGWQLELSSHAAEKLLACGGSEPNNVEAGVRPEAVELLGKGQHEGALLADVTLVESLGDIRLVTLRSGNSTLVAKVAASQTVTVGEKLAWQASWSQWHWFESKSGQRIEV